MEDNLGLFKILVADPNPLMHRITRGILQILGARKIARAFNAVGAARMSQGGKDANGKAIGMPIAGDDENALKIAAMLK